MSLPNTIKPIVVESQTWSMCWIFWAGKITNTTHLKITLNMFNSELRAFWNLDLNFPGCSGTSGSSLTTLSAKNPWNFKAYEVLRECQHSQRVWHSTLMYRIPGCWQLKTKALFNLHLDGTWYLLTSVSDWMKTQKPLFLPSHPGLLDFVISDVQTNIVYDL